MAINCDLCGGVIEMKSGGSAVCTSCGMTYSMEALREKIRAGQDNSAPVSTPAPAPTHAPAASAAPSWIPSTLKMAQMHLTNKNPQDACAECDKVLSADFGNSQAWEIKIQASSMPEAAEFFREYYGTATTDADRERILTFAKNHFAGISEVEGAKTLLRISPKVANDMVNRALSKRTGNQRSYTSEFNKACNKEMSNPPSKDDRYNRDFDRTLDNVRYVLRNTGRSDQFLEECSSFNDCKDADISTALLAYISARKDYLNAVSNAKRWYGETSSSNRTYLSGQYYVDSYSYSHKKEPIFSSTSWEADAIKAQLRLLDSYKSRVDAKYRAIRAREEAEKQSRIKAYWDNNKERKEELDLQKVKLSANIQREKAELETSPEALALKEAKNNVADAKGKLGSLGLFAFKEKKQLEGEIHLLESKVFSAQSAYDSKKNSVDRKINRIKDQLAEIDKELTADRPEMSAAANPKQRAVPVSSDLPNTEPSDNDEEESLETKFLLISPGPNKFNLLKLLTHLCNISLGEAKEIADNCPSYFIVPDDKFDEALEKLIELGAEYDLVLDD